MTTATTEGRDLVLTVEGVDPFRVGPLAAIRGRFLSQQMIKLIGNQLPDLPAESMFIEALGPVNYARAIAADVVLVLADEQVRWNPAGLVSGDPAEVPRMLAHGAVYVPAEPGDHLDPAIIGAQAQPMQHSEASAVAMLAFLWQTTSGLDEVNQFIADGEGDDARVKAMTRYVILAGRLTSPTSSPAAMASSMIEAGSSATTRTGNSRRTVALPAKRSAKAKRPA